MCRRVAVLLVVAATLAMSLGGCSSDGSQSTTLTVYAAASLTDPMVEIGAAYEAAVPGLEMTVSTDSSAALAAQIREGAPADVLLAADQGTPRALLDDGSAIGRAVTFASNALVVVVPAGNPAAIRTPADLAAPGVRIIAAGDAVPITRYATELVAGLATLPGYPAGFVERYAANIASREDNVRAVLAKIELGEGDAGIVYITDARSSSAIEIVEVPDGARVVATYDGVVIATAADAPGAAAFLSWVAGPDGRAILGRFGFGGPP